jgi:peroxidase
MIRKLVGNLMYVGVLVALLPVVASAEDRTFDGSGNNNDLLNPWKSTWGAAGTQLIRLAPAAYADGISMPAGTARPNPRRISNEAIAQTGLLPNTHQMTDWVFQWGQFVDHDVDLTGAASPVEEFDIPIPAGDSIFDTGNTGTQVMPLQRSVYDPATGTDSANPRQQINQITSYLDASNIYGSSQDRADALRSHVGGRLLTGPGNLLPLNTMGLPNGTGGGPANLYYASGDVRANEQVGLTAVHTLFMREHNRLADEIAATNPGWSDDLVFQRARKLVGAEIQAITYQEFLPALLGPYAPGVDGDYDNDLIASISNEFSTALYRVGHTMLPPRLMRMDNDGHEAPGGPMPLRDAFFQPNNLAPPGQLDYLLKGLAAEQQQEVDMHMVDDVRNFLFGEPMAGGFDLAALNIQRGRDHGLADYNTVRLALGLPKAEQFSDISSNVEVQTALASLYSSIDDVDLWVGALAEDHAPGAAVGALIATGLQEQFVRMRDGDRFWYRNDPDLSADDIAWLDSMRLSDIICLNTSITNIQANVFMMVPEPGAIALGCWALAAVGLIGRRRV